MAQIEQIDMLLVGHPADRACSCGRADPCPVRQRFMVLRECAVGVVSVGRLLLQQSDLLAVMAVEVGELARLAAVSRSAAVVLDQIDAGKLPEVTRVL